MGSSAAARGSESELLDAVRRLAAIAGSGAPSGDLAERVCEEAVAVLDADAAAIFRYTDDEIVFVGGHAAPGQRMFTRGASFPLDEVAISPAVKESGAPVYMGSYPEGPGAGPRRVAALGYRTLIGAPITVAGHLWGIATAASEIEGRLPPGSEHQLAVLADMCAAAVVGAERLDRLEAQTAEQAALLAVSRAVLENGDREVVLSTVAREAARLLGLTSGAVIRFEGDGAKVVAQWHASDDTPPAVLPDPLAEMIRERREVLRVGDPDATAESQEPLALGLPFGWGAPLVIDQQLWGAVVVAGEVGFPEQTEAASRLETCARLSSVAAAHVEAREALHKQVVETQQFASLVARSDDFIAIADTDLRLLYVNQAGLRLVGLDSLEEARKYTIQDYLTPESAAVSVEEGRPALAEKGSWHGELTLRNFKTGEEIPISSNSFVITHPRTGERLFTATVQRDLRERKAAEMQLRRRADEVEQLAAARRFLLIEALSAEERMRRQIGDALHDNVLQELYAARQDLEEVEGDDEALYRARVGIDAAVRQLREAVSDLHPAVAATRDLQARLHSILEEGRTRAGFSFDLDFAAGTTTEADDLLLALARELVQNVVKHAGATSMEVKVHDEESSLVLEVADDGRGMPPGRPSEALRQGHIGLASARERVDALGGQLELASEPGSGTRVKVTVPRDGLADLASGAG